MFKTFIAVGSSIGNAEHIFSSAVSFLNHKNIQVTKRSTTFKNPPYGGVAQNDFSNEVWEIEWGDLDKKDLAVSALKLLSILQNCEDFHDRKREKKWEDRTLDLDILMFGELILETKKLTIPHKEIPKRNFVLYPWQEIVDAGFEIPKFGSIETLIQNLNDY